MMPNGSAYRITSRKYRNSAERKGNAKVTQWSYYRFMESLEILDGE